MLQQEITITNPTGLHLRPAGLFCKQATNYQCKVGFEKVKANGGGDYANAKSVLSVLGSCIKGGDTIRLICDGVDESEAMEGMLTIIRNGLGE